MNTSAASQQASEGRKEEIVRPITQLADQSLAVDLARADIDQAIATAHKYPRVLDAVLKKIEMMVCYNEEAAENSIYSLPRGGKPILGPSIGFANILALAWGNCVDAGRPTYVDRRDKLVFAEGGFHDLETNRKTIMTVQRRISGKDGRIFSDDMIGVTGMAAASIARRNAILNAVPRALWHPIYEMALQIVRGDIETFAERKEKALKAFAQFGVKPEQVFGVLGIKGEVDMTLEHIAPMRGMYSALRDGSITVEEMFDPRRMTGGGFEQVPNPLGEDEGADPETGEVKTPAGATQAKAGDDAEPGLGQTAKDAARPQGQPGAQPAAEQKPGDGAKDVDSAQAGTPGPGKAKRGAKGKSTEKDKPGDKKPEPAQQPPKEPDKPAAASEAPAGTGAKPASPEAYKEHLKGWLAAATSVAAVEDTWRAERALRGDCRIVEDLFIEMKALKEARVRELTPKA